MTLTDRIVAWTGLVVVSTSVLVGGAIFAVQRERFGAEALLASLVGMLLALAIAYVAATVVGLSLRDQWAALVRQIQLLSVERQPGGRLPASRDIEVAEVASTINALLERVHRDWERLNSEAVLGHSLIEQTPNGVLVVRGDGRVRYCNAACQQMLTNGASAYDRPYRELIADPQILDAVASRLRGEDVDEFAATLGRFEVLVRLVSTDGGALVLFSDITRFRASERARTDFVANVSHELRTPIASILGYAETIALDSQKLDPEIALMVDAVHRNAQRLRDVFESLLELSRLESRHGQLPRERHRLAPVLERAVAAAADVASQKGQDFELDCDEDVEAEINEEALETIVANFALNACKYTPVDGRVVVRVVQRGGGVSVEVEDNGVGISAEHHGRIFERFYRVDAGRSRSSGGTGLGLAIAKHCAIASGCQLEVSSTPGVGSKFTVRLPVGGDAARPH
jgi:two-component system phosphate regulon sensor histidine kinase PhoR